MLNRLQKNIIYFFIDWVLFRLIHPQKKLKNSNINNNSAVLRRFLALLWKRYSKVSSRLVLLFMRFMTSTKLSTMMLFILFISKEALFSVLGAFCSVRSLCIFFCMFKWLESCGGEERTKARKTNETLWGNFDSIFCCLLESLGVVVLLSLKRKTNLKTRIYLYFLFSLLSVS